MSDATTTPPVMQPNPPKRELKQPRELTREERIRIAAPIVAKAIGKVLLIPAVIIGYVFAVLIGVLVGEVFSSIAGGKK